MNPDAKKTLRKLLIAVPLMFAFGFALVPLYDVFLRSDWYQWKSIPIRL